MSRRKRADRETLCTPAVVCTDSLDSLSREGRVRERIRREEEREREGETSLVCASRSGFTHDRPKGEETPRPRCFLHHRSSLEPPVDTEILRSEEASPKAWRHSLPPSSVSPRLLFPSRNSCTRGRIVHLPVFARVADTQLRIIL